MVSKVPTASKVDTVKNRPEAMEKAAKPTANSKVVQFMVQDNTAKDRATVASNNQATASQDMSMLPRPLRISNLSLTAPLLVNKLKAPADQKVLRKATVAS